MTQSEWSEPPEDNSPHGDDGGEPMPSVDTNSPQESTSVNRENNSADTWNLSDKERSMNKEPTILRGAMYHRKDVKEFIRRLKDDFERAMTITEFIDLIDKLAGEKLSK